MTQTGEGATAEQTVGNLLVELVLRNVGAWIQREGAGGG